MTLKDRLARFQKHDDWDPKRADSDNQVHDALDALAEAESKLARAMAQIGELEHERGEVNAALRDEYEGRMRLMAERNQLKTESVRAFDEGYNHATRLSSSVVEEASEDIRQALLHIQHLLPLAQSWADGVGRSHPDHDTTMAARDYLTAKAKWLK